MAVKFFENCLSTEDSLASIALILKKHIAPATVEPQVATEDPMPDNGTGIDRRDSMDAWGSLETDWPPFPRVRWNTRAELDSLHDKDDVHGQCVADLLRNMFPRISAEDAAGANACLTETLWTARRISESRSSIHIVLELSILTEEEPHALLQVSGDSGQAFLQAFTASAGVGQSTVDKFTLGHVPDAAIPETCPGGLSWSKKLRNWLMQEYEFEAICDVDKVWADSSTTNPRRSWMAYWDFFTAMNNNVPI